MRHSIIVLGCVLYFGCVCALDNSKTAKILYYTYENSGTGPYNFSFESSDGTKREEKGELTHENTEDESLIVHGSYSYTDETGKTYNVKYTADDNGFHPEGDHIKVPPFVPWVHHHHSQDNNQVGVQNPPTVTYLPSTPAPPKPYPPSRKPSRKYVPTTPKPPKKYVPVVPEHITTLKPPTPSPQPQQNEEDGYTSTPAPIRVDLLSTPVPSPVTVQITESTKPLEVEQEKIILPVAGQQLVQNQVIQQQNQLVPLLQQNAVQNQILRQQNQVVPLLQQNAVQNQILRQQNQLVPLLQQNSVQNQILRQQNALQNQALNRVPLLQRQIIAQQNPLLALLLANGLLTNSIPTPRPFLMPNQILTQNIVSSTPAPILNQVPIVTSTPAPILNNIENQRIILEANQNQNLVSSTPAIEFVSTTSAPDLGQIVLENNGGLGSTKATDNVIDLEQFDPANRRRLFALLARGADINEINRLQK